MIKNNHDMEEVQNIEKLQVEYFNVEAGWINIRLIAGDKVGEKVFVERMSHCFDPLPDLKHWLETISLGAELTSFTINCEGNIVQFDVFRKKDDDRCCFSVYQKDVNRLVFQAFVSTKQLVEAFYCGLINLFDSDKYNPEEWEWKPLYENLEHGKNTYAYIGNRRQELTELLSDAASNGTEPDDWDIPDDYFDYKNVSFQYRESILQKLLHTNVNPYNGTSKKEFQSCTIEKYLGIRQNDYTYPNKKVIGNPLINELCKFRYLDSKNEAPPEWWKAIRKDKELYVEFRNGMDVCFNGGTVLKNLNWTEAKGYEALVCSHYIPATKAFEFENCNFEALPALFPKIKNAILDHLPYSSKEGQKAKWQLSERNYITSDFNFENKITFDLIKADTANKRIVFQKFVRADDYINIKAVRCDLQNFSRIITENSETIRQHLEQITSYKAKIGVSDYNLWHIDIDNYTIETIPELIFSDYVAPYKITDDKGRRICKVMEMMENEKIKYSLANINVDGYVYERQLLQNPLENWKNLFRLIPWLERADKIDPAETYTDHNGKRTRPLRHVEFKSIAVQLIFSCSRCNIFVDFDCEKWETGINAIKNKNFEKLDFVSLCKILTILLYSQNVCSLGTHCNPGDLEDDNVLRVLKEMKLKVFLND